MPTPSYAYDAYKQLVLPSIEYCCSIWDPYQQYLINKLEMIQHRAACFVLNKPWNRHQRDSITNMLKDLNWPSLQERRKQSRLILCTRSTDCSRLMSPTLSPLTRTRAHHPQKFLHLQLQSTVDMYRYLFLSRTIPQWNNFNIPNLYWIPILTRLRT